MDGPMFWLGFYVCDCDAPYSVVSITRMLLQGYKVELKKDDSKVKAPHDQEIKITRHGPLLFLRPCVRDLWAKASEQEEPWENHSGRSRLVSQACLPSSSPFWAALGCRFVSQACLSSWSPFCAALGGRCRLVSQACLPSGFLFWSALGCRCRLASQACLPSRFLFWSALGCCCRLVSPAGLSALGCRCRLVSQASLSFLVCSWLPLPPPFIVSILGCSWLPLAALSPFMSQACLPSCPKLVSLHDFLSFWAALGCRCRLVSQACLPSWFPFWAVLGCRLSPKPVSLHDLPSGLLLAAPAALSPKPFSLHDFLSGLLLAAAAALSPKLVSLHRLHSGLLLAAACRLVSQACLSSWSPFLAALGRRCRLVSQACFPSGFLVWPALISSSMWSHSKPRDLHGDFESSATQSFWKRVSHNPCKTLKNEADFLL